jgi:hypothetical protein
LPLDDRELSAPQELSGRTTTAADLRPGVLSERPLCANSSHSLTARRTVQIDPKALPVSAPAAFSMKRFDDALQYR